MPVNPYSQKRLQECWTATASSIREISFFNDAELSDTVVPLNSYAKKTIASTWEKLNEYSKLEYGAEVIPENEGAGAGKRRKNDAERGRA